jgi:hypothetical protein
MRVKNNKQSSDVWSGQTIEAGEAYDIQSNELSVWKSNDKVITDLASGSLLIGDGITYKSAGASAVAYLLETTREVIVNEQPVFAAKKIGTKKLYTRATGKTFNLTVGENVLDFTIPFNEVKFNGLEIDNAKVGESVSLKILDTATGTVTTVPNYVLNQFGYNLNLPNGFYRRISDYDADLFIGLQIRVIYNAIEARTIGLNYMLHELKV